MASIDKPRASEPKGRRYRRKLRGLRLTSILPIETSRERPWPAALDFTVAAPTGHSPGVLKPPPCSISKRHPRTSEERDRRFSRSLAWDHRSSSHGRSRVRVTHSDHLRSQKRQTAVPLYTLSRFSSRFMRPRSDRAGRDESASMPVPAGGKASYPEELRPLRPDARIIWRAGSSGPESWA